MTGKHMLNQRELDGRVMGNACRILVGTQMEKDHSGDRGIDGRIILKGY
jgi:hypothetical protein